jgi:hypothetical protein
LTWRANAERVVALATSLREKHPGRPLAASDASSRVERVG